MPPCSSGSSCPHPPFVQFQGGLLFQSEGHKKGRLVDHHPYVAWQVEILSATVCVHACACARAHTHTHAHACMHTCVCGGGGGGGLVSHKPERLAVVMAACVMTTSPSTPRQPTMEVSTAKGSQVVFWITTVTRQGSAPHTQPP